MDLFPKSEKEREKTLIVVIMTRKHTWSTEEGEDDVTQATDEISSSEQFLSQPRLQPRRIAAAYSH